MYILGRLCYFLLRVFAGFLELYIDLNILFWRPVLEYFLAYIDSQISEWLWYLGLPSLDSYFNEIKASFRRAAWRIWLTLQCFWDTDALLELLHLQRQYLEASYADRTREELDLLDKFENSMNYILAMGSRICMREIQVLSDLFAHFCDLVGFAGLLFEFCKYSTKYVYAKRASHVTDSLRRVVGMMVDDQSRVFERQR